MTKFPETKFGVLSELHAWQDICKSPEWVVYRNFLKQHCEHLQREVNNHLRKHEDRRAGECLRAMDDANKFLVLITNRIAELNKTKGD